MEPGWYPDPSNAAPRSDPGYGYPQRSVAIDASVRGRRMIAAVGARQATVR